MASEFEVVELQDALFSELRDKTDKDEVDAKIDPSEDISNVVSTEVNDSEDNWRCRHCTKEYKRRSSLLRHIKVHNNTFARSALECFNQKKIYKVIIQKNIPTLFCVIRVANRLIGVRHWSSTLRICMGTGQSTAHSNTVGRTLLLKNCWLITLTATQGSNPIPVRSARKPLPANLFAPQGKVYEESLMYWMRWKMYKVCLVRAHTE